MRLGVPSRPPPVVELARLREQADAMPDVEKEQARRRLADLEHRARLATLDTTIDVQTGSGNGPR